MKHENNVKTMKMVKKCGSSTSRVQLTSGRFSLTLLIPTISLKCGHLTFILTICEDMLYPCIHSNITAIDFFNYFTAGCSNGIQLL